MTERLEQMRLERDNWLALSAEDRAKIEVKYTEWSADDFFRGDAELRAAYPRGADLVSCRIRQVAGYRMTKDGPRRVLWTMALNEDGEVLAAFDISYDCPPECPE